MTPGSMLADTGACAAEPACTLPPDRVGCRGFEAPSRGRTQRERMRRGKIGVLLGEAPFRRKQWTWGDRGGSTEVSPRDPQVSLRAGTHACRLFSHGLAARSQVFHPKLMMTCSLLGGPETVRRPGHHPDHLVGDLEKVFHLVPGDHERTPRIRSRAKCGGHAPSVGRGDSEQGFVGDQNVGTGRCREADLAAPPFATRHFGRPGVQ